MRSLPLLLRQYDVLCDTLAEGPVSAGVFDQGYRDVFGPHVRVARKQLRSLGVERLLLLRRPSGTQKDLHDDDTVGALDLEVTGVIHEPPRCMLGDHLEVVALGNAETRHHRAMDRVADRGDFRIRATFEEIDAD